jgi:hypothetical protein
MAARWTFNGYIPDELDRAAAFDANTWEDPGPSTEPTHACIQKFLSQKDIDAIKSSGIHSEGALRVLRRATQDFCDHMWEKRADGRRSTALMVSKIITASPMAAQSSRELFAGRFRFISVSLSDADARHHKTYKFDHFGSENTEDESCFGGFGSAIMIPDHVRGHKTTGTDQVFFESAILHFGEAPKFTLEEKDKAEAYEPV